MNEDQKQPLKLAIWIDRLWLHYQTRGQRRQRRRLLTWWMSRTPGEQFRLLIDTLEQDPNVRKEFRRALRVRGAEDAPRIVTPRGPHRRA